MPAASEQADGAVAVSVDEIWTSRVRVVGKSPDRNVVRNTSATPPFSSVCPDVDLNLIVIEDVVDVGKSESSTVYMVVIVRLQRVVKVKQGEQVNQAQWFYCCKKSVTDSGGRGVAAPSYFSGGKGGRKCPIEVFWVKKVCGWQWR